MKKIPLALFLIISFSSSALTENCRLSARYRQADNSIRVVNIDYVAPTISEILTVGSCLHAKLFTLALEKADTEGGFCRVRPFPNRESLVRVSNTYRSTEVDSASIMTSGPSECPGY